MTEPSEKTVTLSVYRFDPAKDSQASFRDYVIPFIEGQSVMNALTYIMEHVDPSLAHYYSCRIQLCDGCDALIDGEVKLTCETIIKGDTKVEPLPGYILVKDLVVDKSRPKQVFRRSDKLLGVKRR